MFPASARPVARSASLLVCLGAAGVAGCGGGSSFASQADSICKSYNAKFTALAQPTSAAGIPGYLDQAAPLVQQGTAKLAALKPPSDKTTQFQQWTATLQQEVSAVQRAQAAAHGGNIRQAAAIIQQDGSLNAQGKAQAKALGLSECAK